MIPPQANIHISRQMIEQQIAQLESVIGLKKRRIHCLEQRSLRERQWITRLDAKTVGADVEPMFPAGERVADKYVQALKDYYDSEVQIMKVDLMATEMELNIKKAMLEEGLSHIVKAQ